MADEEKTMMNPAEKAAAVISIIGAETASEVFKYLNDGEIEQISIELSRLPRLNDADINEISKEFYECCVTQKVISEGGKDYAKEVLEKAFGQQQARNLMDRVTKALKTKDALIQAICAEEVYPGEPMDGPNLGAEAPVV